MPSKWTKPNRSRDEQDAILAEARERWRYVVEEVDADNRREALVDQKFTFIPGSQWDDQVRNNERRNRLCLEINQLPQFVNNVVNDMRQNRAGISVVPSDDAQSDEAKLRQSVIRGIEYESRADAIYDAGGRDAVATGRGYWRVVSEYESERSFHQRLRVSPIPDFNACALDPDYQEPDGSDRRYGFVVQRMTRKEFESAYPHAEPLDWSDTVTLWSEQGGAVTVADYYRVVTVDRELLLYADGSVGYADDGIIGEVVDRRDVSTHRVEWFRLAGGQQVLDEFYWPGATIPVVCCIGNDFMVEGKRWFMGLTRWARDPQRAYNMARSVMMETAALTPKAPYIMAEGQDEGHEDEWAQANVRNLPYLTYKPVTYQGHMAPPPERATPAVVPPGLAQIAQDAHGDLRATIGLYDPSLGQRSNETSGRAIMARERQGDIATFNFPDNQARAIALTGRIINECMATIYDGAMRPVRMIGPDNKPGDTQYLNGVMGANRLTDAGAFDVRVDVGPGYQTRKQEMRESMQMFLQAFPQAAPFIGDLYARAQDWESHDEVAERLELMLPPQIGQALAAKRGGADEAQQLAQAQGQLQQMQQQMQAMQQQAQQMQEEITRLRAGSEARMMEVQARAQGAAQDAQIRMQEAQMQAQNDMDIARLKAEADAQTKIEVARINAAAEIETARVKAELSNAVPLTGVPDVR